MTPQRERSSERLSLHWEGREEFTKHSGSPQAADDLRGDENRIWVLLRGFCHAEKRENEGLACTPPHILSAKLPVYIFALVFMPVLFFPLTTVNLLLPQFFLSPPFPLLFTSLSPFPHRKHFFIIHFFKTNLNTSQTAFLFEEKLRIKTHDL